MTHVLAVDISEAALISMREIVDASNDNFLELVAAAKLDKRTDFVGMSFGGMNLDGIELDGFDFSHADFRDCSLRGTIFVECELRGAAFSFPPEVRDRWNRSLNVFISREPVETLELMRIASEASRKEERKDAAQRLLTIKNNTEVMSFLQDQSLNDKAKSLRSWLRSRLTSTKSETSLRSILERSLFEGGRDLDHDVGLYIKTMGGSAEAVDTLCQACANNPRAIKVASRELAGNDSFKRFLITCLSFSTSYRAWTEAADALTNLDVSQPDKDAAFATRLVRVTEKHGLTRLAKAAALNNVRLPKLFELCEHGYRNESDAWVADDFLFYCYFYDQARYLNDVLFHCFRVETPDGLGYRRVSASGAFAAYCWVHRSGLYREIAASRDLDYFYVDPLRLVTRSFEELFDANRYPPEIMDELEHFAQATYKRAQGIKPENVIRP